MRASDIGGVGGPAATPGQGPSPQRHRLPLLPLPAPLPVIGCGSSIDNILQEKAAHGMCHMVSTVVAQWFNPLTLVDKVLGSIPVSNIFVSD
jgi:hypothetical protein